MIKDCESVDVIFARFILTTVVSGTMLFGNLITLCVVSYPSLIVIVPCMIIYCMVFRHFRIVIPSFRRIEGVTRSNVFNIC